MSNLENTGDEDINSFKGHSGDVAVIGENAKTEVSLQTIQGIYNELTGKSEEVSRFYNKPFQVELAEIEQLNLKLNQALEQYSIQSFNCTVTIFHIDDTKQQFSSFERFKLHNTGSTSPTESILLKYNFLVLLPKTRKVQTYTVSIRIASRVAVLKKMMSDFYGPPPQIFRLLGNRTAVVEIQFVDYLLARNFLSLIDDWFKVLPKAKEILFLSILQKNSHQIPRLARFITTIVVSFILISLMPKFILPESVDLLIFGKFLALSTLVVYVAANLASFTGQYIESAIDNYNELSYLKLGSGDKTEIEDAKNTNRNSIIKSVLAFIFAIFISVITNVITNYITPVG